MTTIFAYTEPVSPYPGYVNLSPTSDGNCRITVRSQGGHGMATGTIDLPLSVLAALGAAAVHAAARGSAAAAAKVHPGGGLAPGSVKAAPAAGLDLASDAPLAPACDLPGEGTCEACQ